MNKANFRNLLAATLGTWLLLAGMTASANKPENITVSEMALLPPYCPNTMGFKGHTQPYIGKWSAVMGPGFFHMHHYCWALITLRRAERASMPAEEKQYRRHEAMGDLLYVVKNTNDDFILLPEVLTWVGRTEIQLNRPANANEAFAKARALKPDYWPAYVHWAEFLGRHGQKAEALALVKSGLQHAPQAKGLLLLYSDLGGKPGDIPAPVAKEAADAPPQAGDAQPAETPPAPATDTPAQN